MMYTTYEQLHWDEDPEEVQKNWNQIKTHKESHMIHQPEVDLESNWALCWYVWSAVFILLGGGGCDHRNLFFAEQHFIHSDLQVIVFIITTVATCYIFLFIFIFQGLRNTSVAGKVNDYLDAAKPYEEAYYKNLKYPFWCNVCSTLTNIP